MKLIKIIFLGLFWLVSFIFIYYEKQVNYNDSNIEFGYDMLAVASISSGLFTGIILFIINSLYHVRNAHFTMTKNAVVLEKLTRKVKCTHHRSRGAGKKHAHDYDWIIRTNNGEIKIDRIDSQGVKEPPKFAAIELYSLIAYQENYINFDKAVKYQNLSFVSNDLIINKGKVPDYPVPDKKTNTYKLDRVLTYNINLKSNTKDLLEKSIEQVMREISSFSESNIILIVLDSKEFLDLEENDAFNRDFDVKEIMRLERASMEIYNEWKEGEYNDVFIFLCLDDEKIKFTKIISYQFDHEFHDQMSKDIINLGELREEELSNVIIDVFKKHKPARTLADKNSKNIKNKIKIKESAIFINMILIIVINVVTINFVFSALSR